MSSRSLEGSSGSEMWHAMRTVILDARNVPAGLGQELARRTGEAVVRPRVWVLSLEAGYGGDC